MTTPTSGAEFRALITSIGALVNAVLSDLVRVRYLEPELRSALAAVIREDRVNILVTEIIGDVDAGSVLDDLDSHGLADGSVDLALKRATFAVALRRSKYREEPDGTMVLARKGRLSEKHVGDAIEAAGAALEVANSVLKSAAHFVPPAGALGEIKDCADAAASLLRETLSGVTGFVRRGINRVRPAQQPPGQSRPPVEPLPA